MEADQEHRRRDTQLQGGAEAFLFCGKAIPLALAGVPEPARRSKALAERRTPAWPRMSSRDDGRRL